MTDRIALVLGLLIASGIAFDAVFHDLSNTVFLARKFAELIEWVAFWR